jgi:hypothetical protein
VAGSEPGTGDVRHARRSPAGQIEVSAHLPGRTLAIYLREPEVRSQCSRIFGDAGKYAVSGGEFGGLSLCVRVARFSRLTVDACLLTAARISIRLKCSLFR